MIEVQKIPVGVLDTNCYIVTDTDTNEIAIVDPGAVSSKVRKFVDAHKENIKYILLTHGHFDHIAYVSYDTVDERIGYGNILGRFFEHIKSGITISEKNVLFHKGYHILFVNYGISGRIIYLNIPCTEIYPECKITQNKLPSSFKL